MPHRTDVRSDGGAAGRWPLVVALAFLAYGVLVSLPLERLVTHADARGCTSPHALWAEGLLLAGLLLGIACAAGAHAGAHRIPRVDRGRRNVLHRKAGPRLRLGAALWLVGSMPLGLLWLSVPVDRWVDQDRVLSVEAAWMLYAMGAISGLAWSLLLGRRAWLAFPLTMALVGMWDSAALAPHAWC